MPRARRPAPAPVVVRRPPPVYVPADDDGSAAAYVKLPLSPEVVVALREHATNGARLYELFMGKESAAADIFEAIAKTSAALERDVAKVRARLKKRRR